MWSGQRYRKDTDAAIQLRRLRLASKRFKDQNGIWKRNGRLQDDAVSTLFALDSKILTPIDTWTIEINQEDNHFLKSANTYGDPQIDLSEVEDIVFSLEYDAEAR